MKPLLICIISFVVAGLAARADDQSPTMFETSSDLLNGSGLEGSNVTFSQIETPARLGCPAQTTFLLTLDRSLVEREQERIKADSAFPEASPAPAPFCLSRPEAIVTTDNPSSIVEDMIQNPSTAVPAKDKTTGTSTWALFGLGATFFVSAFPTRNGVFRTTRDINL